MAGLTERRHRTLLLTLVVVVLLVNLPLVNSLWSNAQVRSDGVEVTATLVASRVLGADDSGDGSGADSEADSGEDPQYWLSYRLPEDVDPRARAWTAQVDRATWDRARATGEVRVRVLPDDPAAATVEGEVVRRAGLWSTLVVDAVLLGLVLLWWRYRRRRPAAGEGSEDGPEPDEGPRDGPAGGQASSSW